MNTSLRRLVTVGVAAAVALGMTVGTGLAAGAAARPKGTAGLHARLSGASGHNAAVDSAYGAGYFSYPGDSNGMSSVSTSFKMPTFHCHSTTDQEWLLPGIWIFDGGGNLTQQVDVNFNCNTGVLYQQAIICITGASCDQSLTVAPRDTIRASLAYTVSGTIGTIKDVTSGQSVQVVGSVVTTDHTAFIGDVGPSLFGPVTKVPTFSTLKFSNNQVNSQDLSDWSPVQGNLRTGVPVQIKSGAISAAQAFVTTWVHN